MSYFCSQTFDEIISILSSQSNIKGIRIRVKATYFGVSWAAGQDQETFVGTMDRWHEKGKVAFIKFEGWAKNRRTLLSSLDTDDDGASVGLELLPYSDGSPPPTVQEEPDEEEQQADFDDEPDDADMTEEKWVEMTTAANVKPLNVNSLWWKEEDPEGIKTDVRQSHRFKPSLNAGYPLKDVESLFYHFYPAEWIDLQLKYTNPMLQGHNKLNAKTSKGEILQFWGYGLALSIHTGVSLEKMWSTTGDESLIVPPPAMGRHGMSYARFKKLRTALRFGPSDEQSLRADHWAFVRQLVDTFNEHRAGDYMKPGWLITADESMFAWRGQVGLLDINKCPHRSWVPRKPEPLGVELKSVGDALSGVMLRLEICEGKEAMAAKPFAADWGATTATTMRLFEPWFNTDRVGAADSWFAGVKTLRGMKDNGMDFIGDVKTNSSLYPKQPLYDSTGQESGAWATYSAMLALGDGKEVPIFSVSHRRGESVHTFISSCGTTVRGNAVKAYFEDDEERANANLADYEVARKAPCVLNDYTLAQPALDRHNRYRQFILAMEKRILANSFNMRFATSMHGVVFTDVFFAFRYFLDGNADFKAVMSELAYKLMHNSFLENVESPKKSPSCASSPGRESSADEDHYLKAIKDIPGYVGGRQQRCICCNRKTSYCCATCSTNPFALVPLCPEQTKVKADRGKVHKGQIIKHACLARHRSNPALMRGTKAPRKAGRARGAAADGSESSEELEEPELAEECEDEMEDN